MSRLGRPLSLRVRLTLWYGAAMVVVLAVYATTVYLFVSKNVSRTLDENLRGDFQWPAMMMQVEEGKIAPVDEMENGPWLQVWNAEGTDLLYRSRMTEWRRVPQSSELAARANGRPVSLPQADTNPPMNMRILTDRGKIQGKEFIIQVGRSEADMQEELHHLMLVLLLGLPIGVAAAGLGGYSLARRALAPVERMADRARTITAERLGDRLPVGNPDDELGHLATVFNETLTRLESSFDQMRRFTADASHELRTPLTAMRSVGEVGLRSRREPAAYREIIGSMLEEVDRLSRLVDRLLTLSRADNGEIMLMVDVVDLGALAAEVAEQMEVLAEEKQQTIKIERSANARWTGDPLVLRQALFNLVDNAIKYTPPGGRISLRVAQAGDKLTVEVSDTGPGIPVELQPRIFDRFYRVDRSRSRDNRDNGGMGLGLSIARWAVEVSGGKLTLENNSGGGSTFRITLNEAQRPVATPL